MEVERFHFKKISSIHLWAKDSLAQFDKKKISLIIADMQTAGHGRIKGRHWVSKRGNLHMTLVFEGPPSPNLAQILALSAILVIADKGAFLQIKWPNDLIFDGKKVGGAMVEICDAKIIMSIGININTPIETDQPTFSLGEITNTKWDLNDLATAICQKLFHNLSLPFSDLQPMFNELLAYKGQAIRFCIGEKIITGICVGIDAMGHLQLKQNDGTITSFSSGEIQSLRVI